MEHWADAHHDERVRICLVDDSRVFLRTAIRFLQEACCDKVLVVGTASGGEEALAWPADLRPQVVLLDLNLPGLSGLETLRRLRRKLPRVAIIVLSLLDDDGSRQAALRAGADDFISKDRLFQDLLPAVQRAALSIRRAARAQELSKPEGQP